MLPANYRDSNICIVGLGYVGLTLAVAMAEAGFRTVGIERDERILACLRTGRAHFSERDLDDVLAANLESGRLVASGSIDDARGCTVFIITIGTPVTSDKKIALEGIETVARSIAAILKDDDIVILRSTVKAGTTRTVVKPLLDKAGRKYDLAFCPERTLEGLALHELRTLPQLVGGLTNEATLRASQIFSFLTPTVIRVRNPETAEVAKLFNNTQRDYLFAFANEVAAVCESVGVSAAEVIASCNRGYERSRIPMPGPVGGPCLEKDPYIMADTAESFGLHTGLTLAARQWNERLPVWTVERIASEWKALGRGVPKRVAVLGLAFKGRPETNDLRGTLARPIIAELRRAFPGAALVGYDPMVSGQDARQLDIDPMASADDALLGADIAVIQTNHERFSRMRLHTIAERMSKPAMIYDYWGQFVGRSPLLPPDVHYLALGEPRAIPDNGQSR